MASVIGFVIVCSDHKEGVGPFPTKEVAESVLAAGREAGIPDSCGPHLFVAPIFFAPVTPDQVRQFQKASGLDKPQAPGVSMN